MDQMPDTPATDAVAGAPRTETERQLTDIWRAVLKCERVGIFDDFLALGGHSLSATLCINHIRHRFSIELPLDMFFLEPAHIAEFARCLDEMRKAGA